MARRLSQNLNSAYIEAMNRLQSKQERKKIVAYVESYNDVFFWSTLLRPLETDRYYFEVMLPSRTKLSKGKKEVLSNELGPQLGAYMIACVDADYDYLMQGTTLVSKEVCENPYVFHTYVYAIENFQCYAPALHNSKHSYNSTPKSSGRSLLGTSGVIAMAVIRSFRCSTFITS